MLSILMLAQMFAIFTYSTSVFGTRDCVLNITSVSFDIVRATENKIIVLQNAWSDRRRVKCHALQTQAISIDTRNCKYTAN